MFGVFLDFFHLYAEIGKLFVPALIKQYNVYEYKIINEYNLKL